MSTPALIDQAVLFGTSLTGLERLFRFVEAAMMLIQLYPELLTFLIGAANTKTALVTFVPALVTAIPHIDLVRRWMRTFKFMDAYLAAHSTFHHITFSHEGGKALAWLSLTHHLFMGTFGLAETITIPDLMNIEGIEVFGKEQSAYINFVGKQFWFIGLVLAVPIGLNKYMALRAKIPPPLFSPSPDKGVADQFEALAMEQFGSTKPPPEDDMTAEQREAWSRGIRGLKLEKRRHYQKTQEARSLARDQLIGVLATCLDILLPGSMIGAFGAGFEPGFLASVMLLTSVLTALPTWRRCGSQAAAERR